MDSNKEFASVQVEIACRHGNISDEVQDYIVRKAEKLLTYFERVTAISVTVEFEEARTNIEIIVDAEHKHNFVATDSGSEVMPTFDQALHRMEQQIRRYKEKIQDHRRDRSLKDLTEEESEVESSD